MRDSAFQPFETSACLWRGNDHMKLCRISVLVFCVGFFSGCGIEESDNAKLLLFTKDFDFNQGIHGWEVGFADFPSNPEDSTAFQLRAEYSEPVDSKLTKRSLMLSGNNRNNDLFMYVKKKVDGLQPNGDYTLTFGVELASDVNAALYSAGGAVYLKVGASNIEPKSVIDGGQYVMNIDKGNQAAAGEDMISLGDIYAEGNGATYALVTRNNTMSNSRYTVRTNSQGELWLIIGTDSGLGGITTLYYTRINVVFSAS